MSKQQTSTAFERIYHRSARRTVGLVWVLFLTLHQSCWLLAASHVETSPDGRDVGELFVYQAQGVVR